MYLRVLRLWENGEEQHQTTQQLNNKNQHRTILSVSSKEINQHV